MWLVGAWNCEANWLRPRGKEKPIERNSFAVGDDDLASADVDLESRLA